MNRRTIWVIISLMIFALIGLVSFQIYWINSALKLNQERFARDVQESLQQVANRLEKKETLFFIKNNWKKKPDRADSTFQGITMEIVIDTSAHPEDHKFSLRKTTNDSIKKSQYVRLKRILESNESDSLVIAQIRLPKDTGKIQLREELERVNNKQAMVDVVLSEMLHTDRKIRHRIKPAELSKIMIQEFTDKGIPVKFEYGIFDLESNKLIYTNTQKVKELKDSDYRASLFPNDLFGNAHYLFVNFPDEKQYLFKQIWATLASSILFLAIIIGCFIYVIMVIVRKKKLSEMKTDFINNMTHELKTPIATISLASEALSEPEVLYQKETSQKYLGIIRDENKKLEQQVEQVLEIASFERKDFDLNFTMNPVNEIIEDAVEELKLLVKKENGSIDLQLKATPDLCLVDAQHLSRVIQNLVDNAIKYSSGNPQVTITTLFTNNQITISVEDKGVGIPKEERRRIFDKFYRRSSGDVHDIKGFGVGLYYVKTIVEAHQGQIILDSQPGKGSIFKIILPQANG